MLPMRPMLPRPSSPLPRACPPLTSWAFPTRCFVLSRTWATRRRARAGRFDSCGARRPRPACRRSDRHWQDGCLFAADHEQPGAHRSSQTRTRARRPQPPSRCQEARGNGRGPVMLVITPRASLAQQIDRGRQQDRRRHRPRCRDRRGWRELQAADRCPQVRLRHPGRNAGPSGRLDRAGSLPSERGQGAGARRGRSHARHGLFARRPPHCARDAGRAPDAAVLGRPSTRRPWARSPTW